MFNIREIGIYYSLLLKVWQAVAGLVTIALITRFMDPLVQGYYYAFTSLIALQSFFELGLYLVVSVSASHEWAHLQLNNRGYITGDAEALSRLVSLGRFVFKWYGAASALFLLLAGGVRLYILSRSDPSVTWTNPWLLHVAFSAGNLWLLPFLSLLEGCNLIASTALFRLLQSVISSAAAWAMLVIGAGLWTLPALSGVSFGVLVVYLAWHKRLFFGPFYRPPTKSRLSWRYDLLPMQWRLAVQGLFSYLSFSLYPILTFAEVGGAEAGRIGMSLQIVNAIQSLALVLLTTRAPAFAIAVAKNQRETLEKQWRTASIQALSLMIILSVVLLIFLWYASVEGWLVTRRVLPLHTCGILVVGSLLALTIQCVAFYLRAHKVERLMSVGVVSGGLYGLSAWAVAPKWGSFGISLSYLVITTFVAFPLAWLIFISSRRVWKAGNEGKE